MARKNNRNNISPMDDTEHFKRKAVLSDQDTIDSELIGIVYEAAFDPFFWPDLLEGISHLFNEIGSDVSSFSETLDDELKRQVQLIAGQLNQGETQRLAILLPHLYRALKLKREYNDADHSRGVALAILEQFPFGVLLVSDQGKVISANQHGLKSIANSQSLILKNDILHSTKKDLDQQLKSAIYQTANSALNDQSDAQPIPLNFSEQDGATISLLITPDPYPNTHYDSKAENYAAVFIGSASIKKNISISMLQSIFGLSKAEARLASLLATGVSLDAAAELSGIAKNTAKVQLKSVFSKVGVNRQAELIKYIFTSPAVFNADVPIRKDSCFKTTTENALSRVNKEGTVKLSDGRRLQYAEFGDPDGKPVIHLHGVLGSRYERYPDDNLTSSLGVRLIVPDRPGYGNSEFVDGRGFLDFADDLLQLIDHLDIAQCYLMGLSIGAIYASAFAYQSPKRLHKLAMISSTPPFRSFADLTGVPASFKLLIALSKYLPSAARMITEIAITNGCKDAKKFLSNIPTCDADEAIFHHAFLQQHFINCLLVGSKNQHDGFVSDILLSAEPWPFSPGDIQTNIEFWHGTEDRHSPLSRIKSTIDAVPNKRFNPVLGGGHFLIYDYWRKILLSLFS